MPQPSAWWSVPPPRAAKPSNEKQVRGRGAVHAEELTHGSGRERASSRRPNARSWADSQGDQRSMLAVRCFPACPSPPSCGLPQLAAFREAAAGSFARAAADVGFSPDVVSHGPSKPASNRAASRAKQRRVRAMTPSTPAQCVAGRCHQAALSASRTAVDTASKSQLVEIASNGRPIAANYAEPLATCAVAAPHDSSDRGLSRMTRSGPPHRPTRAPLPRAVINPTMPRRPVTLRNSWPRLRRPASWRSVRAVVDVRVVRPDDETRSSARRGAVEVSQQQVDRRRHVRVADVPRIFPSGVLRAQIRFSVRRRSARAATARASRSLGSDVREAVDRFRSDRFERYTDLAEQSMSGHRGCLRRCLSFARVDVVETAIRGAGTARRTRIGSVERADDSRSLHARRRRHPFRGSTRPRAIPRPFVVPRAQPSCERAERRVRPHPRGEAPERVECRSSTADAGAPLPATAARSTRASVQSASITTPSKPRSSISRFVIRARSS